MWGLVTFPGDISEGGETRRVGVSPGEPDRNRRSESQSKSHEAARHP